MIQGKRRRRTLSVLVLDTTTLTSDEGAASRVARTLASVTSQTTAALFTTCRAAEAEGNGRNEEASECTPCEAICFDTEMRILAIASEAVATFDSPRAEYISFG